MHPTADDETVNRLISRYDGVLQLALMLVHVSSQGDELDGTWGTG